MNNSESQRDKWIYLAKYARFRILLQAKSTVFILVSYLNFPPLEVVSLYRDLQLQVGGNYSYLFNLRH